MPEELNNEERGNETEFLPAPPEPLFPMTKKEANEALEILRDLFSIENPEGLAAKALKLAGEATEAAQKEEFYIAWIYERPNGRCIQKVITRDKQDGENLLAKLRNEHPQAIINWRGPMDYITGRRLLSQNN
jgi:hypothetical protein